MLVKDIDQNKKARVDETRALLNLITKTHMLRYISNTVPKHMNN
jgi:hypothetical protein